MRKVPELRFDGFEGEWEENRLENLGTAISGNISIDKSDDVSFSLPVYKVSDMNLAVNNIFMNESQTYVSSDKARKNKMKVIKQIPSIIFAKRGAAIALERKRIVTHPFLLDTNMMAYSPNNDHEIYFLKQYLDFKGFYMFIQSGALPAINIKDINSYKIKIPNYSEQEKIGDLFRKIDALIEIQEGKVSKMQDYKKSMLQKMFPKKDELVPEFRFYGFDSNWLISRLGEVTSLRGGYAFKSQDYIENGIPILRISNINSNGTTNEDYVYYTEILNDDNISLDNGAIVLAMSGATTGKISILKTQGKVYQNQRVGYFTKSDRIDYLYLSVILRSHLFTSQLDKILIAGAQPNISSKDVEDFSFKLPSLEEQQKIGQFFKNLDSQIENEEKLLDSYKMMKKSLLQKMFV